MSYAVKNGTAEYFWIDNDATPPGHVRYDGPVPGKDKTDATQLIWGADISNLRVRTQAELDALPAARLAKLYLDAKALLTADDAVSKKEKGVLLVILDEFNGHATKINAILTAIDGAATFAAMKTAIAAITDYPQRTAAQIKTSVGNKIDAGGADS